MQYLLVQVTIFRLARCLGWNRLRCRIQYKESIRWHQTRASYEHRAKVLCKSSRIP